MRYVLGIFADLHEIPLDDLLRIVSSKSGILSLRLIDPQTEEGVIPLPRQEALLRQMKGVLLSAASYVLDPDPILTHSHKKAKMYVDHCDFLQTQQGSFISRIALPTDLELREGDLFKGEISGQTVNERLMGLIAFLNEEIEKLALPPDMEYIDEHIAYMNLKLLKSMNAVYEQAKIRDIDFTLQGLDGVRMVQVRNMDGERLTRLQTFIEQVGELLQTEANTIVRGRVEELKSTNPDGENSSVMIRGWDEQGESVKATAILASEDYKAAVDCHGRNLAVEITGLSKGANGRCKFLRVDSFRALK
ncbi:MAG: hypothetical protein CSA97_05805 [Bacteroidetes bacterium]|nr:MAG: hypothetical protein CSA97_05805 [Bacteroidota bacterium]